MSAFQQSERYGSVVGEESVDGILVISRIKAAYHCLGTVDDDNDRFILSLIGAEMNNSPNLKNQAVKYKQAR